MDYKIIIVEMRRVIQQACKEIISHEQMADCLYRHITDAVEDYLYECRVEQVDE